MVMATGESDKCFNELEEQIAIVAGCSIQEFNAKIEKEYYCDFSSDDPNAWIIQYDPTNIQIIVPKDNEALLTGKPIK